MERVLQFPGAAVRALRVAGHIARTGKLLTRAAIYLGDAAGDLDRDIGPDLLALSETSTGCSAKAASRAASVLPHRTPPTPPASSGAPNALTRDDVAKALEQCGGNRAAASPES